MGYRSHTTTSISVNGSLYENKSLSKNLLNHKKRSDATKFIQNESKIFNSLQFLSENIYLAK